MDSKLGPSDSRDEHPWGAGALPEGSQILSLSHCAWVYPSYTQVFIFKVDGLFLPQSLITSLKVLLLDLCVQLVDLVL